MPAPYTRVDCPNQFAPAIWFNQNGGPIACLIPMQYAPGRYRAFVITEGGLGMKEIGHIRSIAEGIERVEILLDEQGAAADIAAA